MNAIVGKFEQEQNDMGLFQFGSIMLTAAITVSAVGYMIGKPVMQMILG